MKYRKPGLFLVLVILAASVLPASGCTGYADFAGHAYVWTNAPAGSASQFLEAEDVPEGYEVRPLEGVTITANDKDGSHPFTMVSNADGYFHENLTVEFQEDVIMKVNHPGYKPVTLQFDVHKDRYFYTVVLLLVPVS